MSKSKGNIVNPDEYIDMYGCDSLRLYLMFMGPFSDGGDFQDSAMEGMYRWINRVWRLITAQIPNPKSQIPNKEVIRALNKLVKKVTEDIEKRRYNTAIAAMMEFTNLVADRGGVLGSNELKTFTLLLAPFAPYLAEELWQRVHLRLDDGNSKLDIDVRKSMVANQTSNFQPQSQTSYFQHPASKGSDFVSVHRQPWPSYDQKYLTEETVTVILQVNGKLRGTITVDTATATDQKKLESLAKGQKNLTRHLKGKRMKNIIFVPGKLVNFVVR